MISMISGIDTTEALYFTNAANELLGRMMESSPTHEDLRNGMPLLRIYPSGEDKVGTWVDQERLDLL